MREATTVRRALLEHAGAGTPVVLATLVRARGSTPRKEGASMLVGPGGKVLAGTVGGGCGEGQVLEAARATLADKEVRRVQVDLTRDLLSLSPAVCGGRMEILVEYVEPHS